jgi:hypothetical protein
VNLSAFARAQLFAFEILTAASQSFLGIAQQCDKMAA